MLPFPGAHSHSLLFLPFFGSFLALGAILLIVPYWFIYKKAGFAPWIALLMVVPLINLITLYVVAFSAWKVVPASQVYPAPGLPPQV